jgi:hypothetical protein
MAHGALVIRELSTGPGNSGTALELATSEDPVCEPYPGCKITVAAGFARSLPGQGGTVSVRSACPRGLVNS